MRLCIIICLFAVSAAVSQSKHELRFEDMWMMERLGSFDLSPDGKNIVYNTTAYSLDLNKGNSNIFIISREGRTAAVIANSEKNETNPKYIPVSGGISYLMDGNLFACASDGQNSKQVFSFAPGISDYVWSHDGKRLLFTADVYPDCTTEECNTRRDEEKDKSKVKASVFNELMYRHWNRWRGDKRSHLFYLDLSTGKPVDITAASKSDVPPIALGSARDFSFSPDDREIAFTMNPDTFISTSTNNEIYLVKVSDVKESVDIPRVKISFSKGNDNQPAYSPDGKYIAYCSMSRAGFEADRQRILLYDRTTGKTEDKTVKFDRSAAVLRWSPDSKTIYFTAPNEIYTSIFALDISTGRIDLLLKEHMNDDICIDQSGGTLIVKQQRSNQPYELFSLSLAGKEIKPVTAINDAYLKNIEMNAPEPFWCKGAGGTPVQTILVKPPFFDAKRKYPMVFLIHGGPQGHWSDDFHFRWNLQMFAAQGYVVVAPNPRGSNGYGQKFTDEISGDWGGKAYTDLMNAYDYALKNFPFIDAKNTFAAGASYGGYMINWIAGHTNRFNALVSHAGVFNLESMYGTTEELWFTEWEMRGTPWTNRKLYEKFSPHRFIDKCKTPMLVVHGANDFRVPEEQAFQLFTSLQRLGVESKFLYFPDETHFVAKPQNAKLWWKTIFNWFAAHIK